VDPEASAKLFRALEQQRTSAGLARRARWRLAWSDLVRGKDEAAIQRLEPLTRGSQWDIEVQRARYWTAIAKLEVDAEKGRAELEQLAATLPLSYYGLIAAERLGKEPLIERSFVGEKPSDTSHSGVKRAGWLFEAGFPDAALDELASWIHGSSLNRSERLETARLLHRMGDHFRAVRILVDGFGGALEQGIDPEWRAAWQMAWPRPFDLPVRQAVEEFQFDSALVYAVMREESTYQPRVKSSAGALGLMQLIPTTADRIAQTLGVGAFRPEDLFDPETNIRFGTYYLKDLVGRFGGSFPLTIAAYNAGPEAVAGWLTQDGALAHDAFVESVPYPETRRYLRRVLRSYRVYRLLYGGRASEAGSPAPQPNARLSR
jgi:soluble lytic murein transglycosylase